MLPTPEQLTARTRVSGHGAVALLAMLAPGLLFPAGLFLLRDHPRFSWLHDPARFPWELWVIAICGIVATIGGCLDWRFHRSGLTSVGHGEHLSHVAALIVGGGTLFLLMCAASLIRHPLALLIPIVIVALFTATLICYDEFVFHRKRCDRYETLTHRMLVFGNSFAWIAWLHWCFVRSAINA